MGRVLFVATSTTLGGAEKTLYSLATLLDPKSHQVVGAVSLKPNGVYAKRLLEAGIPVRSLELKGAPGLKEVTALAKIIDETKPDIVHALMYQAIQLCRLAKRKSSHKFKLISSPRVSYRTRSTFTLLVDRVLKSGDDLLISECEASRRWLVTRQGYSANKIKTIYNGVDIARWPISKPERTQKRLELRLEDGELLIGTIGRLDQQKSQATLIEAMARLNNKMPPTRCVILGEGTKRASLEGLIKRWHLEKRVHLLGERPDAVAWLSALDIFVLPSLWEGMPNALLEAMALGLPCIASSVDGVLEAVADNQNGLLVPPRNAQTLAKRINELATNALLRQRLGAAAKETIASKFTLLDMMANYEKTYAEVLAR